MAGYTVIYIEGVLAHQDRDSFAASPAIREGLLLYHGMKQVSKVLLVTDHLKRDQVEHWLKMHGLRDHVMLLTNDEDHLTLVQRARHVGAIDLAVTAEPAVAEVFVAQGVTTVMLGVPEYLRPEFRAIPGPKPWDGMLQELEQQRDTKSEDPRITADVAGTRYDDD